MFLHLNAHEVRQTDEWHWYSTPRLVGQKSSLRTHCGKFGWTSTHRSALRWLRNAVPARDGLIPVVHLLSDQLKLESAGSQTLEMPIDNNSAVAFLIPRCFRRKKTPPTSDTVGNIFEARMKKQLKKQIKQRHRHRVRPPVPLLADDEFATFDLLAARDQPTTTKDANKIRKRQWPSVLSWDSVAETYVSPPSSVGAEAGGVIGTTHTKNLSDNGPDNSDRFTVQLTRQRVSQEAVFRLQQLAHLDMDYAAPLFAYQLQRQSARKWSETTTKKKRRRTILRCFTCQRKGQ